MKLYSYKAIVVDVYDGDTITVDIDLGMGIWLKKQKIRLADINTPEIRGKEREEGLKVRDWLRNKILNKEIILETIKDTKGKYGRWLGKVWFADGEEYTNINMFLVMNKMAEKIKY